MSDTASQALASVVPAPRRLIKASPVTLLKSIKNEVELDGFVNSHARDAAALCSYLCWLDKVLTITTWPLHNGLMTHVQNIDSGSVTEVTGADRLEQFRSEQDHFMGLSFPSISSVTPPTLQQVEHLSSPVTWQVGPNGAIIHYRPAPETARTITRQELYLVDSGAQYR